MDSYKIIYPIALGDAGATVTQDQLEEAGVNIAALVESGHIECVSKPATRKATSEE